MDLESFGVQVKVNGYDFDSVRIGLELFKTLVNATPEVEINNFLYNLAGTRGIDKVISGELDPMEVDFGLEPFLEKREDYLIYQ
jgi:hypothetical protein